MKCDDSLAQFKKQLDQGWFTPAQKYPPFVPFRSQPAKLVPKDNGQGLRFVVNASYPYANVRDGAFRAETGGIWPVDSNSYTVIPSYLDVEWPSVESVAELFAVVYSATRSGVFPVQLRKLDNKQWFRQLANLPAELWKNVVRMRAGFHTDNRVEMGIMVVTVGEEAAEKVIEGVKAIMAEFGIPLSDKPHCNLPFE